MAGRNTRKLEVEFVGDTSDLTRSLTQVTARLKRLEAQNARTADSTEHVASKFSNLDNTVGDFNRTMTGARNVVGLIRWPALIAGAGAAAQVVGALGAGAIGLGSALAPLAGGALAYGAAWVAVAQAGGVAKLAMAGLDKALAGDKKALADLTPAQRTFVDALKAAKEQVKGLRQVAASGLLPGLGGALRIVSPLLSRLKPIVHDTAVELGTLAVSGARTVRGWGPDLTRVGQLNVRVIHNLGMAAIAAADGARHLIVAGGPLLLWLSHVAREGAEWVRAQIAAGRESGRLAAFLTRTRAVMSQLGTIIGNVAVGLFNIGRAAAPLGGSLLTDLQHITAQFRAWTQSTSGRQSIVAYFNAAREPVRQLAGLVGDLGGAFLRLSNPRTAGPVVAKLRELVPILENLIAGTTGQLLPSLIDAVKNIARVAAIFIGTSGPLTQLVRIIGALAGVFASVLENNNGLQSMAVTTVGLVGTFKAMSFVFGPIATGVKLLTVALIGEEAVANTAGLANLRLRASVIATGVAMYATQAATALATAATTAFGIALAVATSPITLIVVGLAALAVGLVVAYEKVGFFHDAVDNTFGWIKDHWPLLLGILTGPIGLAVVEIVQHAGAIAATFKALPGEIVDALHTGLAAMTGAGQWLVNRVIDGVEAMAGAIRDAAGWIKNRVVDGIHAVISGFTSLGGWLVNRIVDGVHAEITGIAAVGGWIKNRISDGLLAVIDGVRALGGWVVNRVVEGVRATPDGVVALGGWVKNRILDGLNSVKDGITGLGGTIIDWIVAGLKAGANKLVGFLNDIIHVVNKLPGVQIGDIAKFAEGGVNGGGGIPAAKLARGGAFGLTGGMVNAPIVMMGEEAPHHPEFVIPTNPAYRKRAQGLLAQAAGAIGFAKGGILGGALGALGGLGGDVLDAIKNGPGALIGKLPDPSDLGWLAGLGKFLIGKVSGFIKDKIGGIFRSIVGGGGDAPTGGAAGKILAMIAQASRMDAQHLPYLYGGGHGSFDGPWDCSGAVSAVLHAAGLLGSPITTDGLKTFGEAGDGKWVTIGVRGSTGRNAHTMMKIGDRYFESGGGHGAAWTGGWDGSFPIHRHPPGLAKGGMFGDPAAFNDPFSPRFVGWGLRHGGMIGAPFGGAFADGGVVPGPVGAPRFVLAHGGETITPAGQTPEVHVYIGDQELKDMVRVEVRERDRSSAGTARAGVLR